MLSETEANYALPRVGYFENVTKINLITFWCKILIFFKFKIKNSN